MKKFETPEMTVVRLTNEDIIRSSSCPPHTCFGFECDDCADCPGVYYCAIFDR